MKRFGIWLATATATYGAIAGGWHLYLEANPHSLAVVVDASYPMQADWGKLAPHWERIAERRYTRFALATEKGLQHSWDPALHPERITPYAPRDFERLRHLRDSLPELREADEVWLITNAGGAELAPFADWTIVRP